MTFWLIVALVLVVAFALAWWVSGRMKPNLRRRGLDTEMAIRVGNDQKRNTAYGPPYYR